ncbi:MAG TPA: hypothetical protein EYP79_02455 [Campylobacterales bacterium]|nr:hypothetical protein [Campylobacterales bacterium]
MKRLVLLLLASINLMAGSCEDWYKKIRAKYHIVGTKTGIVMDYNGNWKKIFAKGTASVDFADEDEYEDALMEAEEEAKANIAHFLKERIYSDRFIDNISKTLKEMESNRKAQATKVNKKILKTRAKSIHNSANSLLKGVVVLCESIDSKNKRAVVIVGVSPKTQRAADSARRSIYSNSSSTNLDYSEEKIIIKDNMDVSEDLDF